MDNTALVSIIIPIYNVESFLSKCLQSVIDQSYRHLEIVCIDDGSTDESSNILKDFAAKDARIECIRQNNAGLSAARNTGLERIKGDWVAFVDSDDYIEKDMIQELLSSALKHDADLSFCDVFIEYPNGVKKEVQKQYISGKSKIEGDAKEALIVDTACYAWNKLYKAEIFKSNAPLNYPEGHYFEDVAIFPCIIGSIKKAVYVEKPLYHYIIHKNSITQKFTLQKAEDFFYAIDYANSLCNSATNPHWRYFKEKYLYFHVLNYLFYLEQSDTNKVIDRMDQEIGISRKQKRKYNRLKMREKTYINGFSQGKKFVFLTLAFIPLKTGLKMLKMIKA